MMVEYKVKVGAPVAFVHTGLGRFESASITPEEAKALFESGCAYIEAVGEDGKGSPGAVGKVK